MRCCYLGMFVQAIVINLTPVLFIPLKEQLGLRFEQLGRLILINFVTQVAVDLVAAALVPRTGVRPLVVAAHVLAFIGLLLFGWLPDLVPSPYAALVAGTVVFSMGGGLLELLLSPITNAVPSERKTADMSLLHSFYAWGQLTVALLTTVAVFLLPSAPWRWVSLFWALPAALGAWAFTVVPLPPFAAEAQRHRARHLIRLPAFMLAVAGLGLAGASEVAISQWMSAFAEKALHVPKLLGDIGGFCLFAAGLGAGRTWYGLHGHEVSIRRRMIGGAVAAVALYVIASLSPSPWPSLAACACAGLAVSLFWPGLLAMMAARYPQAGASMFAVLSASGDTGAALAPWVVGLVADRAARLAAPAWSGSAEGFGLRMGLLLATVFPLVLLGVLIALREKADE